MRLTKNTTTDNLIAAKAMSEVIAPGGKPLFLLPTLEMENGNGPSVGGGPGNLLLPADGMIARSPKRRSGLDGKNQGRCRNAVQARMA